MGVEEGAGEGGDERMRGIGDGCNLGKGWWEDSFLVWKENW